MTYEEHRNNLIDGLWMQVGLGNWVKVAELAIDLRVLEAQEAGKPQEGSDAPTS